jgi:hypothetical protein
LKVILEQVFRLDFDPIIYFPVAIELQFDQKAKYLNIYFEFPMNFDLKVVFILESLIKSNLSHCLGFDLR